MSKEVRIIPQSSLSAWLKSRLRRKGTKVIKNTSSKSPDCKAGNVKQVAGDKEVAVSIAIAKVGSVAARGVLNAVEAQAGALSTARMANYTVEFTSKSINFIAVTAVEAARRVRDDAKDTTHPTKTGGMNLRPVAIAVSRHAQEIEIAVRKVVDDMGKQIPRIPSHDMASFAACIAAIIEVNRAFIEVVEAYIASIAAHTRISIRCLKKLVLAAIAAATESARRVEDTVIFMEKIPPPPYADLKPLK